MVSVHMINIKACFLSRNIKILPNLKYSEQEVLPTYFNYYKQNLMKFNTLFSK